MSAKLDIQSYAYKKSNELMKARGAAFASGLVGTVERLGYLVGGVGSGLLSLACGGRSRTLNSKAYEWLGKGGSAISFLHTRLLQSLNPSVRFQTGDYLGKFGDQVGKRIVSWSQGQRNTPGFFHRHLLSRLGYLANFPATLVARGIDGLVGLVAGIGSIVTFGTVPALNGAAHDALRAPMAIQDLYYSLVKAIHPDANLNPLESGK